MRVIPVIDLLNGLGVHAVKGRRKNYRPVKSVLCDTPEPLAVARAFRDRLNLNEVYVADLDAILDPRQNRHRKIIADIACREGMDVILDAGVSNIDDIRELIDSGIRKVVIGAETLRTLDAVHDIPAKIHRSRLVFSLDLRAGKILSQCPALAAMEPLEAAAYLQPAGWGELILLDLGRVGGEEGIGTLLAAEVRAKLPVLRLLVGGGLAGPDELVALQSLGVRGVLTASALHRGIITAGHLSALGTLL